MLKSINLKHIYYFYAVAKEESISKASAKVNVSQSSISEQITLLEKRLSLNLFDRTQRNMILTTNGTTLFNLLDSIFPKLEELLESLVNHKSDDVKYLRIGLSPSLSAELKYNLCFPFIEDYHYTVKAIQGENEFLMNAYIKDEIDLFFTSNDQFQINSKFEKYTLIKNNFVIVMSKRTYLDNFKSNKITPLNNMKFINFTPDSDLHFKTLKFLLKNNITPIRIAEIDDINLIKSTLLSHDCFAFLPKDTIVNEEKNGQFKIIKRKSDILNSSIKAIYRPKFKTERFLNHLKTFQKNYSSSL